MIASLVQDLRYAARWLRRSPGFTLVCLTTIALAVGANTAIFGVVHGVILKALPFADPERVVMLGHRTLAGGMNGETSFDGTTPGNLHDWMRGATGFEAIAGFAPTARIITTEVSAEQIRGGLCVGPVFEVLGRQAAEGRTLRATDDDPGAPPVVLLSARLARRLFPGGSAVDRPLTINGTPHTVVGVMADDFAFLDHDYEYWVPARFDAAFRANRDQYFLAGLARLKPGVSREQAAVQLNTVMDAIRRDWPQYTQNAVAAVVPAKDVLLDGVERRLVVLMGAAIFVLLVACANLGNLLLARASTRRREMALRHALGAGHGRLVRQMLVESVLLATLGGLLGLAVGAALLRVLLANLPEDLPRLSGVEPRRAGAALHGRHLADGGTPVRRRAGPAGGGRLADARPARRHEGDRAGQLSPQRPRDVGAGAGADAADGCRPVRPQLRRAAAGAAGIRHRAPADVHGGAPDHALYHRARAHRLLRARRQRDRAAAGRHHRDLHHDASGGRTWQRRLVQHRRPPPAGRPDAAGHPEASRARQLLRRHRHSGRRRPRLHRSRWPRWPDRGRHLRLGRQSLLSRPQSAGTRGSTWALQTTAWCRSPRSSASWPT